ncbi:hypothetical protein [Agrobacterium sp. CG674]
MKLSLSKNLDGPKNAALSQIDADAQGVLALYRTSSDYAVAVYALKRDELNAYASGATPDTLAMMSAEARALGIDPTEVARIWRQKISDEDNAIPRIESVRQAARQRVKNAKSPAEIQAVIDRLDWT